MRKQQLPQYAIALAIVIVGLVAVGVPLSSLLVVPLFLACPLMMVLMMRGMDHGGSRRPDIDHERDLDEPAGREARHPHDVSGR